MSEVKSITSPKLHCSTTVLSTCKCSSAKILIFLLVLIFS